MKLLTLKELEELYQITNENAISIYLPTHKAGKEVLNQKDARTLKNHYQQIKKKLAGKGMHENEIENLLQPINQLINDGNFWRQQLGGLAIFLSDGFFRYYRLPIPFEEFRLMTTSFYLKPLAQTFSDDEYYFILALSLQNIRLYEANKYFIHEIDLQELFPDGVEEILNYYEFEKSLQMRSQQGGMNSGDNAQYYGQGGSKQDVTPYIEEYFRKIDEGLGRVMTSNPQPMVLAAVDYLHPIFKKVTKTSKVVDKGIMGNPDHLKADELHVQANQIMEPFFKKQRNTRFDKYKELEGTGKTSNDIKEIAKAAMNGRIEALFAQKGNVVWGKIYENNGDQRIELHKEFESGDNCLIDQSIVKTLLNGGETYLVENDNSSEVYDKTGIAALFRY